MSDSPGTIYVVGDLEADSQNCTDEQVLKTFSTHDFLHRGRAPHDVFGSPLPKQSTWSLLVRSAFLGSRFDGAATLAREA